MIDRQRLASHVNGGGGYRPQVGRRRGSKDRTA